MLARRWESSFKHCLRFITELTILFLLSWIISFTKISIYFLVNDELFPEKTSFICRSTKSSLVEKDEETVRLNFQAWFMVSSWRWFSYWFVDINSKYQIIGDERKEERVKEQFIDSVLIIFLKAISPLNVSIKLPFSTIPEFI